MKCKKFTGLILLIVVVFASFVSVATEGKAQCSEVRNETNSPVAVSVNCGLLCKNIKSNLTSNSSLFFHVKGEYRVTVCVTNESVMEFFPGQINVGSKFCPEEAPNAVCSSLFEDPNLLLEVFLRSDGLAACRTSQFLCD